jgi:hypothetical protein
MKLTADSEGKLVCPELFSPLKTFDATRQADGSIRIVELPEKLPFRARLVRQHGRTYLDSDHPVSNQDTQALISQFP